MATKRILYFTAEDHYLYRSVGPALELEAKFTGDDLGITAFREYLLSPHIVRSIASAECGHVPS